MNQDTKNNKLSESIEFLADFQLLFGNIIRINGAFLEVAEKICSNDELITVPIWRVIAVIRINPMTVPEVAKYLGIKRQSVQSTVNQMKKRGLINLRKVFKDEKDIENHISFIKKEILVTNKDKRMMELKNWLKSLN